MITFTYTLRPQARVSAGLRGEVQHGRDAHRVIPGSVIRGALGAAWWTDPRSKFAGVEPQAAFDDLFGRSMTVSQAVPTTQARLESLSEYRCKYRAMPECWGWRDAALEPPPTTAACPHCGEPLEYGKRGWVVDDAATVVITRTALSGGVAKDGDLFARRAMRRDITLAGTITVDADPTEQPPQVEWLRGIARLHVGGSRSTMGTCEFHLRELPQQVSARGDEVAVRLLSPAILLDAYGAASTDFAGALAKVPGAGTVGRVWARTVEVGGWHSVAGLPKPVDLALVAGSTAALSGWSRGALDALLAGIGVRRMEGYGQVALVRPDGSLTGPVDVITERSSSVSTPGTEPPPARQEEAAVVAEPASPGLRHTRSVAAGEVNEGVAGGAGTSSGAVTASAQETASPPSSVTSLATVLAVVPEERHRAVVNGLLGVARQVGLAREERRPEQIIGNKISVSLTLPWARHLSGEARDALTDLLLRPDISLVIAELEASRRELA